jgi:hypothetical protein
MIMGQETKYMDMTQIPKLVEINMVKIKRGKRRDDCPRKEPPIKRWL